MNLIGGLEQSRSAFKGLKMSSTVEAPSENLENMAIDGEVVNDEAPLSPNGDIITPWEVASSSAAGVDYDKLTRKYT